ncbi:unnamed protein product, partial [Iphiclides podalirius]
MADSFFGFDTSFPNLNDDEGGGGPSEDEYDALNDETFGQDSDELDWEVEHEQLAEQLESSRRNNSAIDEANSQLEASISRLVLDETDAPQPRNSLSSSVWRHDLSFPTVPAPVQPLKNVCTVEELERQMRQNQMSQQQGAFQAQNYFQPRFPPVILQRPPGLQAPVSLPYAPQQTMAHNINQMNQPMNKIIGQTSQMNQIGQGNQLMQNHMAQNVNQLGQGMNQLSHNMNQMNQNMNHIGQNVNQLGQNNPYMQNSPIGAQFPNNQMGQGMINQMQHNMQNVHQMSQANQMIQNPMGQNSITGQFDQSIGQMGQNMNQIGQNLNQIGQNLNQMGHNINQMGQSRNMNPLGPGLNQMGQNVNQMMTNGGQFAPGMNQFSHMMGQPRMVVPPPGMGMQRPNFSPSMNQFNPNFRGPMPTNKGSEQLPTSQQNITNQQMMKTQSPMNHNAIKPMGNHIQANHSPSKSSQVTKQPQASQRMEAKQKPRIYNTTTTKMTSPQNLTKFLMQGSYPVQQYNSFHNASHHPMLNNRGAVFTNSQYTNHPMLNNQPNGTFNNGNRLMMNGDDNSVGSDVDEYAGLMTQREKQWLINIQMLQLNTGTPYIHDFYYTVFLERQANKEKEGIKEAHKANQQNHPFYSGAVKHEQQPRERHNSHRHNSTSEDGTPRTYVPTQFENSLGKLQCGSVTAPRKIIDLEVVAGEPPSGRVSRAPSVASTTNPAEVPREVRRTKQLLLDIEALYLILLRLEELNDPLAISNALILKEREEKQRQLEQAQKESMDNEQEDDPSSLFLRNIESVQRRPKQESPKSESIDKRQVVNLAVSQKPAPVKNLLDEDKDDLLNKMFAGLLHSDRLPQMLTVRKGRALVARRRVGTTAPSPPWAPHYRRYIQNSTGWSAILESCGILSETIDPARTPHSLTTALTLSCVCAMLERAILLVSTPEATSSERQWFKFLKSLARALKNTTLTVAKPAQPLPTAKVVHHLKQLESRSTIEILQRGRTTAEFADLTKGDVSELLIKHLC